MENEKSKTIEEQTGNGLIRFAEFLKRRWKLLSLAIGLLSIGGAATWFLLDSKTGEIASVEVEQEAEDKKKRMEAESKKKRMEAESKKKRMEAESKKKRMDAYLNKKQEEINFRKYKRK